MEKMIRYLESFRSIGMLSDDAYHHMMRLYREILDGSDGIPAPDAHGAPPSLFWYIGHPPDRLFSFEIDINSEDRCIEYFAIELLNPSNVFCNTTLINDPVCPHFMRLVHQVFRRHNETNRIDAEDS